MKQPRGVMRAWADTQRGNLPNLKFIAFHPKAKKQVIKCQSQRELRKYLKFLEDIGFVYFH